MRRSSLIFPFLIALAVARVSPAMAHAFPDHSSPAVGGVVAEAPKQVQIWFTQKIEAAFSRIEVFDSGGKRVDAGNASVDPQDGRLLRVSLKALPAGAYKVQWHVVSVDTHASEGNFTFTVSGA